MIVKDGICHPDGPETPLLEVSGCRALDGTRLRVRFSTGEVRDVDMSPLLSLPAFRPLATPSGFRDFSLEDGVLTWLDGTIDIAPEWLFDHGETVSRPETGLSSCCVAEDGAVYGAGSAPSSQRTRSGNQEPVPVTPIP